MAPASTKKCRPEIWSIAWTKNPGATALSCPGDSSFPTRSRGPHTSAAGHCHVRQGPPLLQEDEDDRIDDCLLRLGVAMSRKGPPLPQEHKDDGRNSDEDGQDGHNTRTKKIQELHAVCCSPGSPLLRRSNRQRISVVFDVHTS
jgi:hypothetical protein